MTKFQNDIKVKESYSQTLFCGWIQIENTFLDYPTFFQLLNLQDAKQTIMSRDLSRDDCIEEFIKRILSSGLVWAVGLQSGLQ